MDMGYYGLSFIIGVIVQPLRDSFAKERVFFLLRLDRRQLDPCFASASRGTDTTFSSLIKVDRVETLTVEEAFKAQPVLEKGFEAAMKEAQHKPQAVGAAVVLVRFRSFEHMKAHCVLACQTDPIGIEEEGIDWKEVIDKNQGRPCIGCSLPKAGRA